MLSTVGDIYSGEKSDDILERFNKVLEEQERLHLLQSLHRGGTCTRDILAFITNQADLRTVNKEIDKTTTKHAMEAKIRDCKKSLTSSIQARSISIKNCLEKMEGRKYKVKKMIKGIRRQLKPRQKLLREKNQQKIKHLKVQMEKIKNKYVNNEVYMFKPTKVPERLKDYGDLCIFRTPKDLPAKQALVGPFLCHPDINQTFQQPL